MRVVGCPASASRPSQSNPHNTCSYFLDQLVSSRYSKRTRHPAPRERRPFQPEIGFSDRAYKVLKASVRYARWGGRTKVRSPGWGHLCVPVLWRALCFVSGKWRSGF